jgi:L-ribulose-5-phosphate 3-epimerase UlaE
LEEINQQSKLEFGIVQGRLIESPAGLIQYFPKDNWEDEFSIASSLSIENIELIADREYNSNNPIWTDEGLDKLINLSLNKNVNIHTVCNDHIINYSLINNNDILNQNLMLIEISKKLNCNKYILPFFEESELNMSNFKEFIKPLRIIAEACQKANLILCIETILNGKELLVLLNEINHINVKVVFDTGNRIAFGHDLYQDIILLNNHIEHIHIKDKNINNENVLLGSGLVNFLQVFKALNNINYKKSYTFETVRGSSPTNTCKHNISFINYFYNEAHGKF